MFCARSAVAIYFCAFAPSLVAQTPPRTSPELAAALGFEVPIERGLPRAWSGGPAETIALDRSTFHSGETAARMQRAAGRSDSFTSLMGVIPIDFTGDKIELVGHLRTENVVGFGGLWLRED